MPKSVHERGTRITPRRPGSDLTPARGRQVQSGRGGTGRDRAVKRRSRR